MREALRCSCLESIFDEIEVMPAQPDLPEGWLVGVGGRLLLLSPARAAPSLEPEELEALLQRGRCRRDAGGFNRFRRVLPRGVGDSREADGEVSLPDSMADEGRFYLHRLAPERLASLQAWLETPA